LPFSFVFDSVIAAVLIYLSLYTLSNSSSLWADSRQGVIFSLGVGRGANNSNTIKYLTRYKME